VQIGSERIFAVELTAEQVPASSPGFASDSVWCRAE
jgi:hypothetical protein